MSTISEFKNLPSCVTGVLETFFSVSDTAKAAMPSAHRTRYEQFSKALTGEGSTEMGWTASEWKDLPNFMILLILCFEVLRKRVEDSEPDWSEEETEAVRLLVSRVPRRNWPIEKKLKAEMRVVVRGLREGVITQRALAYRHASYVVSEEKGTVMCLPHNHDCSEQFPCEGRDYFVFKYRKEDSRLEDRPSEGLLAKVKKALFSHR